jgi:hypothetical protein
MMHERVTVMTSFVVAWRVAAGATLRVPSPLREIAIEKLGLNVAEQHDQG